MGGMNLSARKMCLSCRGGGGFAGERLRRFGRGRWRRDYWHGDLEIDWRRLRLLFCFMGM